jgi:hypothetical protein
VSERKILQRIDYKKKLIEEINKMPDDLINVETSSELIEGDMNSALVKYTISFYRTIPIEINIKLGSDKE